MTSWEERIQGDEMWLQSFKVSGADTPKEGDVENPGRIWKGLLFDQSQSHRDVVADISTLLAGNPIEVLTEVVPEVKLPKYEDVYNKLQQVADLYRNLSTDEYQFKLRPSLDFHGSKFFSEHRPPIEKFSADFFTCAREEKA